MTRHIGAPRERFARVPFGTILALVQVIHPVFIRHYAHTNEDHSV
ncbi:MAG: hypothetical protein KatS3mg040_0447 [Candidatus Kapaibacterium sp.]|nr:MAG: hypothetical protein KatS3mg040_0447 [Candidatus Kapabacteria bacterium]